MPSRKAGWVKGILASTIFAAAAVGYVASGGPLPQIFGPEGETVSQQLSQREYRTFTLPNGLPVFLTRDPGADKSAAALAVGVGFLYDPADKPGLAHYLEHMEFLGTKKYPVVGSYQEFLKANGGGTNAYTTTDKTNYFFEVRHQAFDETLDRFSDFFKEPLFDTAYAETEVEKVNEEFNMRMREDGIRRNFLESLVSEPGHPVAAFGVGNKETLGGGYYRETLLEHYNRYYAASNMKLAMISNLSLDEQERLVRKHFESIRDFKVEHPQIDPVYRKPLDNAYRLLEIEAVKDIRIMSLEFPTIRLIEHNDRSPESILSSLIGNEGEGSLLTRLKQEGLAEGLSAGGGNSHPDINNMSITIALTPKGLANRGRILELVFSYIDMLKTQGIQKYTFEETRDLGNINFNWSSPPEGSGYASAMAAIMFSHPLKNIQTDPFLLKKFDPDAYRQVLETMTPGNMLVTVQAQGMKTDKTAPWYGTPYALTEIGGESFTRLLDPPKAEDSGMFYPAPNEFIPNNLVLEKPEQPVAAGDDPHLVVDSEIGKVWSLFDTRFNQPKAYLSLEIETPAIYDTVDHFVRSQLLEACVDENLASQSYPLKTAGLEYQFEIGRNEIVLNAGGYTERLNEFIEMLAENMTVCNLDNAGFEIIKDRFIRSLQNTRLDSANTQAGRYSAKLFMDIYSDEEKFEAVQNLTLQDIRDYARELFARVRINGMAHGNWNDDDVKNAVDTLVAGLGSAPLPEAERPVTKVGTLHTGENAVFSAQTADNNNALRYMLQAGPREPEREAALQLLNVLVQGDFYQQMRVEQSLAYMVNSGATELEDNMFLSFAIQSRHDPALLQQAVEAWKKDALQLIDNMSDADFETLKQSLVEGIMQSPDSLEGAQKQLFYFVASEDGDFDYIERMAANTQNLTKAQVRALAEEMFLNPATPSISIHIRSQTNDTPPPAGAFTTIKEFKQRSPSP